MFGVEMFVLSENILNQIALLVGKTLRLRPGIEVFAELVFRTLRNGNCWNTSKRFSAAGSETEPLSDRLRFRRLGTASD